MMGDHDLLKVSEIAKALRVSKMSIYRLINAGQLEVVRVGRAYRVKRDSYLAYLERQTEDVREGS